MQSFVTPGGGEPQRETRRGLTCEVNVTSCFQRSRVMQEVSTPRGLRAAHATCVARRSHVWLIAHRMREKNSRKSKKMAKGVSCSPLQLWDQHCGLVPPLNQTNSDKQKGGLSIVRSGCFDILLLTEARQRDLEKPVFEMCLHGKSQQATCFSILYLFHFTGLWAISQLGQLPSEAIQHGWPALAETQCIAHFFAHTHTHVRTHFAQRFIISQCHF